MGQPSSKLTILAPVGLKGLHSHLLLVGGNVGLKGRHSHFGLKGRWSKGTLVYAPIYGPPNSYS